MLTKESTSFTKVSVSLRWKENIIGYSYQIKSIVKTAD